MKIDEDFETMLICAERYACGRQTYMPSVVIGYIRPLLKELSEKTLFVLKRDIEDAGYWGSETIDKPVWMDFLNEIKKELESRTNE